MAATKISSQTAYVNVEEFEGDTLELVFTWKDSAGTVIDLSAYTAQMAIKTAATDTVALLTLTQGAGITLDASAPNLSVIVTNTQTATLGAGKYVYDIQLTDPSGRVNTLVSGVMVLVQSVTP